MAALRLLGECAAGSSDGVRCCFGLLLSLLSCSLSSSATEISLGLLDHVCQQFLRFAYLVPRVDVLLDIPMVGGAECGYV